MLMALNLDLIGKRTDRISFSYDQDAVMLYALGIGAGDEVITSLFSIFGSFF